MKKEEFQKLPQKCQRMAIAEDVIKRLSDGEFSAKRGSFGDWMHRFDVSDNIRIIEDMKEGLGCEACALGGMFISCIKSESIDATDMNFRANPFFQIKEKLGKIFSEDQLELIECAFESGQGAVSENWTAYKEKSKREDFKKARDMFSHRQLSEERLLSIMQNILENDGEFVPR